MRSKLSRQKLLKRIPEDLEWIFNINPETGGEQEHVGDLWDPSGNLAGGKNWSVANT